MGRRSLSMNEGNGSMSKLSHMQINIAPENQGFYKDLLGELGWETYHEDETMFGAGAKNGASLWFAGIASGSASDYDGVGVNHIALGVDSQADVDSAAAYLQGKQVELLFDTPRHRPDFSSGETDTYYQIMFESPDKLLFEIVYMGPKE